MKQRVALRCQLQPLDEPQTRAYVLARLERAGRRQSRRYLRDEALCKLYEYSRGIPRIVNTLCENSMVNAFAREQRTVTPEMITEVAADFRLTSPITAGGSLAARGRDPRRTAKACCARCSAFYAPWITRP